MKDALSTFKPKSGLFLNFADGDEVKLRILTLDPVVSNKSFEKNDGEMVVSTKYAFVIYNWTDNKAQILEVGPGLLKKFVNLHKDEDTPALNHMDIKISATGEQLKRRYEVIPLPKANELTNSVINEAKNIKLDEAVKDNIGRLSDVESEDDDIAPANEEVEDTEGTEEERPGYDQAKSQADALKNKKNVDRVMGEETQTVDLGDEMPDNFML